MTIRIALFIIITFVFLNPIFGLTEGIEKRESSTPPQSSRYKVGAQTINSTQAVGKNTIGILKTANWIWYPGDFEIWLHDKVSIRRNQRGVSVPQIIRMDSHYQSIQFKKETNLNEDDTLQIFAEGIFNVQIDSKMIYKDFDKINLPKGKHIILISVYNYKSIPSIFVLGKHVISDNSWDVSCYDKKWYKAGYWNFDTPDNKPSKYKLFTVEKEPVKIINYQSSILVDFGKETFGYLKIKKNLGKGNIQINYGETIEEAESDSCETLDAHLFLSEGIEEYLNPASRAFRYVKLNFDMRR